MQDGGVTAVEANDQVVSVSDYNSLLKKVKQLEQMLGRKTVEAEILKDALEIAQAKSTYRTCPYYHPTIPNTTNSTNTRCVEIELVSSFEATEYEVSFKV